MKTLPQFAPLLLSACMLCASDPWTPMDKARQAALTASLLVDWGQTNGIEAIGSRELNPLLGHHPSSARIAGYFAISILNSYLISDWLPSHYRWVYQTVVLGFQAVVIHHNFKIGLRVQW
mgnify:CR=1 FL=1